MHGLGAWCRRALTDRSIGPQDLGLRAEVGQQPLLEVRVVTLASNTRNCCWACINFSLHLRQF